MYVWDNDIPRAYRFAWAQEEREARIFEEPGAFGSTDSSAEELTDREPEPWEKTLDFMEACEDRALYDEEGR